MHLGHVKRGRSAFQKRNEGSIVSAPTHPIIMEIRDTSPEQSCPIVSFIHDDGQSPKHLDAMASSIRNETLCLRTIRLGVLDGLANILKLKVFRTGVVNRPFFWQSNSSAYKASALAADKPRKYLNREYPRTCTSRKTNCAASKMI